MTKNTEVNGRNTSVDVVFNHLYDAIVSLQMLPGAKISEAEIAGQFGVSRQPVRDAFSRLANLDLLLIRPQRATEVKRFSSKEIEKSRFVRAAVEAEVLRRAAQKCTALDAAKLDECLAKQKEVVKVKDYELFGALDYEFHKTLCAVADVDFAFEVISAEKASVDRLCMLSLAKEDRIETLVGDHIEIANRIKEHDSDGAVVAGMKHLKRLDKTIDAISDRNPGYFEP
jgi:DNA-binding GntR family transcriptional regulator